MCVLLLRNYMTTLAQSWYITANPDKSHDFEDNEDFEQFRDHLLLINGMSAEKLDSLVETDKPKVKEERLSSGTIYRRSHNVIREALRRNKLSLINIQRFLLSKLYYYSQQLEDEVDEELVAKWESQIDLHLKRLDTKSSFETLLGVFAKVLTLSPNGKTMMSYLGAKKKKQEEDIEETDDSNDDTLGFIIPR